MLLCESTKNMEKIQNGLLIAIEGIDGTGKSTLAKGLEASLSDRYATVVTKEPGGTALGKGLRNVLLQKDVPICDKAEFLLFATDRAQHFDQIVLPSLAEGKIVISDRMNDSSIVYQGHGRNLDLEIIGNINRWVMNGREPDIVFYLRLPIDVAYERMKQRGVPLNSFEQEKGFLTSLNEGFERLIAPRKNVVTLNAELSPVQLVQKALEVIQRRICELKV